MRVTTFKGRTSTQPETQTTLADVLEGIKSDKWKSKILKCRQDLKHKDWLPAFTPTGQFNYRSIAGLEHYNGVICLDIDNIYDPEGVKECAKSLPWVHACFVTASGRGLKVIIITTATTENYTSYEESFASYWANTLKMPPRDKHCHDIARIQYISWDPNLYYNPDSTVFDITKI